LISSGDSFLMRLLEGLSGINERHTFIKPQWL